jgi:hypothetical protein
MILRVHAERAGDRHALLLAAGELAGIFVRLLGDLDALQVVHRRLLGLLLRHLAHPDRRQRAVLQDRQVREQVEVLEHHADFAAHLVDLLEVVGQFDAVDDDLALLVLLEPVDAADQRRLARARLGPADDDALAAHDVRLMSRSTWNSPYHLFMPENRALHTALSEWPADRRE